MDMISNECPTIVCLARHIEALECFVEGLDKWPISLHKVLTHSCSYITDLFTLLQVHVHVHVKLVCYAQVFPCINACINVYGQCK